MTRVAQLLAGAALAAFVASGSRAADWSDTDRVLLGAALLLHAADWSQTLRIVEDDRWYEINPVLGRHPSRGEVNTYFAGTAALMFALAHALPEYRRALLTGYVALGLVVVGHNLGLGIRVGF